MAFHFLHLLVVNLIDSRGGAGGPASAACHHFHAGNTVSDAKGLSLHLGLATEGANIFGVLADFGSSPFSRGGPHCRPGIS